MSEKQKKEKNREYNKVKNNVRKALFLSFLGKIPALIRYGDTIGDTRVSCGRKKKRTMFYSGMNGRAIVQTIARRLVLRNERASE